MKRDVLRRMSPLAILRIVRWRIIGILLAGATLLAAFVPPLIVVNENQILYYMSCLAQVTAALFALILAAYTIADTRLKSIATADDTLLDYIPEIQNEHFRHIITISINCIFTILLCLITINTYSVLPQKLFSVLIVDVSILGGISAISLILFVWVVCDPKAFQQKGESAKDEMDQAYAGDKGTDDFRLFLGYYNRLESLINRYAVEISGDDYDYKYQRKQLPIFQALDILMSHQIFDEYAYIKIDEFRRYRNALVHSTNPESVNSRIYDELKKVYELLESAYSAPETDKQRCILSFKEYCKQYLLNELDKKIIGYLKSHQDTKISDIAQGTGISTSSAANIVKKLVQAGIVHVEGSSRTGKVYNLTKYSLQGTTQGNGLTGGLPPVRFSM